MFQTRERVCFTPLEKKYHKNLRCVIIHTGSNDVRTCKSPEIVAEKIILCASEINVCNPHVHVVISALLPRVHPKRNLRLGRNENELISVINHELRQYCIVSPFTFMENWDQVHPGY